MTKSFGLVTEFIRDAKPLFRQLEDRPKKSAKHRYVRRKIRGCLRLADWGEEFAG
jgi:hypothetical protein